MNKLREDRASLCIKDKQLIYNICTLFQYIDGEDISFKYVPNYEVIDILPTGLFEGIQGLNLDLREKEYIRKGIPTFVSERIPPRNRVDLDDYIKKTGLDYYDPIALLKTIRGYNGDNIYACEYIEPTVYKVDEFNGTYDDTKQILIQVALNNQVIVNNVVVDNKTMFIALYPNYAKTYMLKMMGQRKGVLTRKEKHSYKGRKAYPVNKEELSQLVDKFNSKQMSIKDIKRITGWSKSTFYRKMKLI